jgi:hypothetical protein
MKLLCYADLHATDGDELSFTHPTTTLQHYRVEKFFRDLRAIYDKYECNGVIDLGDMTGDRSSIPVPTIEVLGNGLDLIPDSTWNIKLIGNHEQYLRNASVNVRRLFDHKFTVISENKIFDFDGWRAFFCSYPASHDVLARWIAKYAYQYRNDGKILFGHFQVAGCALATGIALQGIPADILKPFELCLLGHVHLPQTIGNHIHYIGSPFQQNWGESAQQKRVAVLDTSDPIQITWVALPGYPEYRQVSLEQFKKMAKADEEHRYKVVLASHEEAEEYYHHPLFSRHPAVYNYSEVENPEATVEKDWSLEGVCQRWMETLPPNKSGIELEKQELLEIGLSIANGKF